MHQTDARRAISRPAALGVGKGKGRIDAARIERALVIVAILLEDNERYLPIYLRLEEELATAQANESALDRARARAAKARDRSHP